jgi:hypothetical protein
LWSSLLCEFLRPPLPYSLYILSNLFSTWSLNNFRLYSYIQKRSHVYHLYTTRVKVMVNYILAPSVIRKLQRNHKSQTFFWSFKMPALRCRSSVIYINLVLATRYGHCHLEGLQCVDLPQCPPVARDLYRSPSRPFFLKQLRAYRCGLKHGPLQVCCPIDSVIHPTPIPKVTGILPDTSIFRHRNLKLINRHCGLQLANRIAGGENALPGEFPWLAVLQYNGKCRYSHLQKQVNQQ